MPRNWPIQAGATSLGNGCSRLLNSTRLGPGAEHEKRAADYPESREGYRESAHPRMRSARIIQLRLRLCPLIEVNRPLLLQCGNFGMCRVKVSSPIYVRASNAMRGR